MGALRLEIAVLQEQKSSLSSTLEKLTLEMKTREDGFTSRVKELQATIAQQREEIQCLGITKEECVAEAEREGANAKKREEELSARVVQLEGVVDQMSLAKDEEIERIRTIQKDEILELEGRVVALTRQNEDLAKEKEDVVEKRNTLLERYATGDLVGRRFPLFGHRLLKVWLVGCGEGLCFDVGSECTGFA